MYSDHKPCLALKGLTRLTNERMRRWAAALATFDYVAYYAKGASLVDCDALSRMGYIEYDPKTGKHPADATSTPLDTDMEVDAIGVQETEAALTRWAEICAISIPPSFRPPTVEVPTLEQFRVSMEYDPLLHDLRCHMEDRHQEQRIHSKNWAKKISNWAQQCVLEDGLIYHLSGPLGRRLWVPVGMQPVLMHLMHDIPSSGHLGSSRTLLRLGYNYFWRGMSRDVVQHVRACHACTVHNQDPHARKRGAHYTGPVNYHPFQQISMDIMGPFPPTHQTKYKYVLSIMDLATRWVELIPLRSQSALAVAEAFLQYQVLRFGPPKTIISDRGGPFIAELVQEVCKLLQMHQALSSAYHPQSHGMVERVHAVFQRTLGKYVDFTHTDWDVYLPYIAHAYRTTPHAVTGYSPYFLVHGHACSELVDIALLPAPTGPLSRPRWTQFRQAMLAKLEAARQVAGDRSQEARDKLVRPDLPLRSFVAGDMVYIRNFRARNPTGVKLARKWLPKFIGPYRVLQPVSATSYKVQSISEPTDIRFYNIDDLKAYVPMASTNRLTVPAHTVPSTPATAKAPLSVPFHSLVEEEIDSIRDRKIVHGVEYFLVHFKDVDSSLNQWVPSDLVQAPKLVDSYFRARFTAKARPTLPTYPAPLPDLYGVPTVNLAAIHMATTDGAQAPNPRFPTAALGLAHLVSRYRARFVLHRQ